MRKTRGENERMREEGLECQRVIFKPSLPPVDEIIKEESSRIHCVLVALASYPTFTPAIVTRSR